MTQDEIIEFTKRSGLAMLLEIGGMDRCLEHFAKLVAQHERHECLQLCTAIYEIAGDASEVFDAIQARGQE